MRQPPSMPNAVRPEEALRHLPCGVVVFDAAGKIEHVNPAFLALFFLRTREAALIGKGWRAFFDLLAPALKEAEPELSRVKALIHQDLPDQAEIALNDGRSLLRHYVPFVRAGVIQGALWQMQDITTIKEQQSRLEYLTERDPLTGLLNRRGFDRRLKLIERHALGQAGFTLALIDLDDFKRINDTLGHAAGDDVLVEVASRLKNLVRLSDMPARIGGDEFAILMPECRTEQQAVLVGERLLRAMDAPIRVEDAELHIHFSVGLALQRAGDDRQGALFQRADLALYEAKSTGRRQFRLFSPRLQHRHDALHLQREMLRAGLEHGRLLLHYQPVVTLDPEQGRFTARKFEALLRLHDAQGTLRRAEEFETALADPQLGMEVDRHVLGTAMRQMQEWKRQGLLLRLAVNVSPHHVAHPDFVPTVKEQLAAHPDVAPQNLTLEITEHGQLLDLRVVKATIGELRQLGLRIGLDDFGTGNASLAHLQQFDVSVVKIDRSFVRELLNDGVDLSISYGVLRLAQTLGVSAIAEGVETRAQCRALCLLGFRNLQGYVFAHPMPAEQVAAWLEHSAEQLSWMRPLASRHVLDTERAVQALVAHRMLVRKLLSNALERSEVQDLQAPDAAECCDLGRWLTQESRHWGAVPQFQRLMDTHGDFHRQIVVALANADPAADLNLNACSARVHAAFWDWVLHDPELQIEGGA